MIYHADEKVSLDEYLMLYKGRLHLKQFIKSKRARFGVKVFSLNSRNGFTHDVEIYEGKGQGERWAHNVLHCDELTV